MAIKTTLFLFLFLFFLLLTTLPLPGSTGAKNTHALHSSDPYFQSKGLERGGLWRWEEKGARRLMIGSVAPTCTFNECRGCRSKCRAEQVPVDANDPVNSAYRYRCVCHRA